MLSTFGHISGNTWKMETKYFPSLQNTEHNALKLRDFWSKDSMLGKKGGNKLQISCEYKIYIPYVDKMKGPVGRILT